jgi:hypothetical protein
MKLNFSTFIEMVKFSIYVSCHLKDKKIENKNIKIRICDKRKFNEGEIIKITVIYFDL